MVLILDGGINMAKIKVWISEPGNNPRHVWISNKLENLQKTVEGYIENYALSPKVGIICNEEGMFNDFKFNCRIDDQHFFGTIIFVGYDGEEFANCPLELDEMKKYFPQLWRK